jgi:hypothetical protein
MERMETDSSVQEFCLSIPLNRYSRLPGLSLTCEIHATGIESSFCLHPIDFLWKKQMIESMKGPFTDVVIRVRDHQFPVHKSVLTARCPSFTAEMKDINVKQQLILDEEPLTFGRFLNFIYTGLLDDFHSFTEMKKYAEKYRVKTLPKVTTNETLEKMIMKYFYYAFSLDL